MRVYISVAVLLLFFSACAVRSGNGAIATDEDSGRPYYTDAQKPLRIDLFGDYFFHPVKKFVQPFIVKEYFPYLRRSLPGYSKPQLLYSAHTTVAPYYETIALAYRGGSFDTTLLYSLKARLQQQFRAEAFSISTSFRTGKPFSLLAYTVVDPYTRIPTCYREYFVDREEALLRIIFITTDCTEGIIAEEAERIVRGIQLGD